MKRGDSLLYKDHVRHPFRLANVVLVLCIISDVTTLYTYSSQLYNEYAFVSIYLAIMLALALDASLYYAAVILNKANHRNTKARRRCSWIVALMVTVFALAFTAFLSMVYQVEGNPLEGNWHVVARILLPIVTSLLSLGIGLSVDPKEDRLREIRILRQEVQASLARQKEECQRSQALLEAFNPDQFDQQLYRLNMTRVKMAAAQAQDLECLTQAQALGTTEAVDKLLCSNDLLVDPTALLEDLSQDPASAEVQEDRRHQNKVRLISGS